MGLTLDIAIVAIACSLIMARVRRMRLLHLEDEILSALAMLGGWCGTTRISRHIAFARTRHAWKHCSQDEKELDPERQHPHPRLLAGAFKALYAKNKIYVKGSQEMRQYRIAQ